MNRKLSFKEVGEMKDKKDVINEDVIFIDTETLSEKEMLEGDDYDENEE